MTPRQVVKQVCDAVLHPVVEADHGVNLDGFSFWRPGPISSVVDLEMATASEWEGEICKVLEAV